MTDVIKKHSAGGLVCNNGKVLLINWDAPRSSYDIPKGTVEPGEYPEDTCVREVFEETGYHTKIITFIGQTHYEYDWNDGTRHDKTVDYYLLALVDDTPPTPRREAHETFHNVWIEADKALEVITRDTDKPIIEAALEIMLNNR